MDGSGWIGTEWGGLGWTGADLDGFEFERLLKDLDGFNGVGLIWKDLDGSGRFWMVVDEFVGILMDSNGFGCIWISVYGFVWILMHLFGVGRIWKDLDGLWMDLDGWGWTGMDLGGLHWL